jgi:hypothetical protein
MSEARVREVRSRADRRAYLELVRKPYAANPHWVHPDVRILKDLFRRKTLLARRSDWRALLAVDDEGAAAGLTVFLHQSFEEKLGQKIATIGFLEALPEREAAVDALFREAESWARGRGATRIWGPMNGHIMYRLQPAGLPRSLVAAAIPARSELLLLPDRLDAFRHAPRDRAGDRQSPARSRARDHDPQGGPPRVAA